MENERNIREVLREQFEDALSIAKTVVITCLATFLMTNFVIANAVVPSSSMEKTISPGDRIVGTRLFLEHERGDIVVFKDPDGSGKYLIKRIIGMPGERVQIVQDSGENGSVYINGIKLEETYLPEPMYMHSPLSSLDIRVPADSYFCLGDNRNDSYDARYWSNKFVKDNEIIARAVLRYWPVKNAGLIGKHTYQKGES